MKLMEHVTEAKNGLLRQRADIDRALSLLDEVAVVVERYPVPALDDREHGAASEPIVVMTGKGPELVPPPTYPVPAAVVEGKAALDEVIAKGVEATRRGNLVRARDTGYGFDPSIVPQKLKAAGVAGPAGEGAEPMTLAGALRQFAQETVKGTKFTRSQAETWINDARPQVETKHISAQLSTLVSQGYLLSQGAGRERVFWWNLKAMAGRAGKGKTPFRKQIAGGCKEAKVVKLVARGANEEKEGSKVSGPRAQVGEENKGRSGNGNMPSLPGVGIEEAIVQAAGVLKKDFSRAQLEDWIEKNHPGLIQRELARDKYIIGGTIGKLVDKGTLVRTQEPNALAGKVALYAKA